MEVILLEKVKKLGIEGDVVVVKPGYARNFLIPQKKALRATEQNQKFYEEKKQDLKIHDQEKAESAKKQLHLIEGKFVVLIRQASDDGKLFGSVNARDIADSLSQNYEFNISRNQIVLLHPIKYIGIHEALVELHPEVTCKVMVNIAKSDDEAKNAEQNASKAEVI